MLSYPNQHDFLIKIPSRKTHILNLHIEKPMTTAEIADPLWIVHTVDLLFVESGSFPSQGGFRQAPRSQGPSYLNLAM